MRAIEKALGVLFHYILIPLLVFLLISVPALVTFNISEFLVRLMTHR